MYGAMSEMFLVLSVLYKAPYGVMFEAVSGVMYQAVSGRCMGPWLVFGLMHRLVS